jgi:DNA replication and repair protein RecF
MYINNLSVKNFRNYRELDIEFSPEVNFITGDNGIGKTNILEAITVTSNIKSFRNTPDSEIILWGEESYYCSSVVEKSDYRKFEVGCSNVSDRIKKKIKIDSKEIMRGTDYFGKFLSVIFTPMDINLINGSPEIRRKFFDSVLSKIDNEYMIYLSEMKKILRSRNRILKMIRERKINGTGQLDVWDSMFSEKVSFIVKKRREFITQFASLFFDSYGSIAGDDPGAHIEYISSTASDEKDEILEELVTNRSRDIAMGTTGTGPQRDDYILVKDGRIFTHYASQGQRRTAAISLKMSECEIIEKKSGKKSIILVDDIFSELDGRRRESMVEILNRGNQVIFTMVDPGSIPERVYGESIKYRVKPEGKVEKY